MPEVSVIIPTYNRGHVIKESIDSILQQTFSDFELIVVDDGSSDNTKMIIEEMQDERITFIQLEKNAGACHARNVGVQNARGKYIAFQDSDDIWYPGKLEKQIRFLQDNRADMVFCQMISQNGNKVAIFPPKRYKIIEISKREILKNFLGSTQTFFIKRECFETVCFDEKLPRYQDWEFLIQVTSSYKVLYQAEPLVIQRLGSDSISANPRKGFCALQYILEKYKDDYESCLEGKANILSYQATFMVQMNENANKFFMESLKLNPLALKHWIKFILYKLRILQFRYRG